MTSSRATPALHRPPHPPGHRRNWFTSHPRGGQVLSASQLLWFTARPPRGYGVLTTTGRKTGKTRRRCVRAIRAGNIAYLASIGGGETEWYRNAMANPEVHLRLRDGRFAGTARQIHADESSQARRIYCESFHPFELVEYLMHMRGLPSRDRIRALHEYWFDMGAPFVIELRSQ